MTKKKLEDLASERAVLAALCQYGLDCYLEIDFVDADHFTSDMNQLLYHCIYKSVSENSKVELASILSAANSLGVSESINNKEEMSFIRSLFNFPIHKENAKSHAVKIAKLKLARDLKKTLKACEKELDATNGDEDIMDLISKVEAPILDATADIYQSSNKKTEIIGEDIDDYKVVLIYA